VKRWCGGRTSSHHHLPNLHGERRVWIKGRNKKGGAKFSFGKGESKFLRETRYHH
jgi:hypothetical protein